MVTTSRYGGRKRVIGCKGRYIVPTDEMLAHMIRRARRGEDK